MNAHEHHPAPARNGRNILPAGRNEAGRSRLAAGNMAYHHRDEEEEVAILPTIQSAPSARPGMGEARPPKERASISAHMR